MIGVTVFFLLEALTLVGLVVTSNRRINEATDDVKFVEDAFEWDAYYAAMAA